MFQVNELFKENANIYEIKQIARIRGFAEKSINEYINTGSVNNFTTNNEFFSISASEENNILYVLDILNNKFIDNLFSAIPQYTDNVLIKNKKMLSNYYNPYEGEIDIYMSINEKSHSNEKNKDFLDRKNSKFYQRNKSTIFKNMNSRLTDKIEKKNNEQDESIENIYFMTKRMQI
jgi:hypothetical protein